MALSFSDEVLRLLGDVAGMERVVFGSDYPQVPEAYIKATVDAVAQCAPISRGNGLTLLPRLVA
jgi:predicted TIM-barrel fold metal-dependent hydrolase